MKKLILLLLLIGTTATAQYRRQPLNDNYAYFALGTSAATIPHTDILIANGIFTAGVRDRLFDVSINYEYVNLKPKYHSYFIGLQVIPLTLGNFEFGIGGKYGRVIRESEGVYTYAGGNAETRFTVKNFFISLVGNYDYRGDIHSQWGKDYFVYTTNIKIGIKI